MIFWPLFIQFINALKVVQWNSKWWPKQQYWSSKIATKLKWWRCTEWKIASFLSFLSNQLILSVPNYCWYKGHQYKCGLSFSCILGGHTSLDLCNGGMLWTCCVANILNSSMNTNFFVLQNKTILINLLLKY